MKTTLSLSLIIMMIGCGAYNLNASSDVTDLEDKDAPQRYKDAEKLIKIERYKEAIIKLDKLLSNDKKNVDAWSLYGYASTKTGNYVSADKAYARALSLDPEHLSALENQGELFILQGRVEMAEGNLDTLEKLCPEICPERDDLAEAIAKSKP